MSSWAKTSGKKCWLHWSKKSAFALINDFPTGTRDQLSGVIKEEAASMVKKEVDEQIRDYLPVSLREQAEASRKQLCDIRISLENS